MQEVRQGKEDRSLGELFAELTQEITTLVRQEAELFKTEMTHKATRAGKNVAMIAAGGIVAYTGVLALVAFVIIALANVMPWWASALLVGVVLAAIGGFLAMKGINALKHANLAPEQTIESLKEDKQWAQHRTRQPG